MRIAVFPGSFDPLTLGHVELVQRALPLFDKIVVAVGQNSSKKYLFNLEQRLKLLRLAFENQADKVSVESYSGLTARFCENIGANYLLRGLRNATDFDYENNIAQLNRLVNPQLETVFLVSRAEYAYYSSTLVRELIRGGENPVHFLPSSIAPLVNLWLEELSKTT